MKLSDIATIPPKSQKESEAKNKTADYYKEIGDLQQALYAEAKQGLLVIFQGMDAAGKDGAIKRVFSEVNPMGIEVVAFKKPTELEYAHDYLWRVHQKTPPYGMIHVFNRSHYEDILMPTILELYPAKQIKQRFEQINKFEEMLVENGTRIIKFYLHVSKEEQQIRLTERMNNPKKYWKHKDADWKFAKRWEDFMAVYEDIINKCDAIPWDVIPADQNWYKEYLIAKKVAEVLKEMKPKYPDLQTAMDPIPGRG